MSDVITSILTDANARSSASVEQSLIGRAELASAWFSAEQR